MLEQNLHIEQKLPEQNCSEQKLLEQKMLQHKLVPTYNKNC
jgi:hypothetical protein